jgi:hypothetical protein
MVDFFYLLLGVCAIDEEGKKRLELPSAYMLEITSEESKSIHAR